MGVAPFAARSERFTRSSFRPIRSGGSSGRKWTPATIASQVSTNSRPGGGARTAASSCRFSAPGPASGRKCRAISANSAGRSADTRSGQVDGVLLQIGQQAVIQRALLGRAQHDAGRGVGIQRFLPARRAKAPAVSRLQSRKAELRMWRGQVVAGGLAEGEELSSHDSADRVAAVVLIAGVAAAVAEEAGHRAGGADIQDPAENVARRTTARLARGFIEWHRFLLQDAAVLYRRSTE